MPSVSTARTFEVRHLQMARALLAAVAALMITFSPDHSAPVGAAIFSGFATTTALVWLMAAWVVYPAGSRAPAVTLGAISLLAGMAGGLVFFRSAAMFFVLVIAWAALSGIVETVSGARALRSAAVASPARSQARDAVTVGVLTLVLAVALAVVPSGYAAPYYIEDAGRSFTLTGITIGVGIFGAYAAIVAVYLAIAAFSPRPQEAPETMAVSADRDEGAR